MNYFISFKIRDKKITWAVHDCNSLEHAERKFKEQFLGDWKVTKKGRVKVFGKIICSGEGCVKMRNYWFNIITHLSFDETPDFGFENHESLS